MKERLKLALSLFVSFLKIGLFTIGGGYAMLPIIQHEVTDKKRWVADEQMTDYLTLAQASPGIIGTNTATAVGWHTAGFLGAVAATLGMIAPSVVIITLIAMAFESLNQWELALRAFKGVRAAVVALMLVAVTRLAKTSVKNTPQWGVACIAALLIIMFNIKPQYIILCSAAAGLALTALPERNKNKCKR